jgi:hypothetical protein
MHDTGHTCCLAKTQPKRTLPKQASFGKHGQADWRPSYHHGIILEATVAEMAEHAVPQSRLRLGPAGAVSALFTEAPLAPGAVGSSVA